MKLLNALIFLMTLSGAYSVHASEALICGALTSYAVKDVQYSPRDDGRLHHGPSLELTFFPEVTTVIIDASGSTLDSKKLDTDNGKTLYAGIYKYDLPRQQLLLDTLAEVSKSPVVCVSRVNSEVYLRSGNTLEQATSAAAVKP